MKRAAGVTVAVVLLSATLLALDGRLGTQAPGTGPPPAQAPGAAAATAPFPAPGPRPRVIVTTDGEVDDRDSMIRFLMYANEWEVEALIYSSSRFHWLGNTSGSVDPDGDKLSCLWWHYRAPGKYKGDVVFKEPDRAATTVQVPADAKPGDTVHLIAQVTDAGKPPLTRYARVIVTVGAQAERAPKR
jgi:hypothetical protein